jgi:hypothetical protein
MFVICINQSINSRNGNRFPLTVKYRGARKIEHIKKSHRCKASEQFISQYINKMNKTCKVCQNIKPFEGSIKLNVPRKHLGRAAKELCRRLDFDSSQKF